MLSALRPHLGRHSASLLAGALLLGAPARAADNPAEALEAEEIEVVGTSPVPGVGTPLEEVPANVQAFGSKELERQGAQTSADFLWRNAAGVSVNDGQGNPWQPDVSFRGFTASPLLGTPQGLSVFLDGVRVNEPFGDVVNWDLVPPGALSRVQLVPGSTPALGLNTLGGSVSMFTKSGSTSPGLSVDATAGAFGRKGANLEAGGALGDLDGFVALNLVDEPGWARHNPSRVAQLFAKGGHQTERTDLDLSVLAAATRLEGTQTLPASWLADRREAYTYPDRIENRLVQLHLKGSAYLSKAVLLGGSAYVRDLRTSGIASNTNTDFDPLAVPLAPTAFDDRSAVAALGWGGAVELTLLPAAMAGRNRLLGGAAVDVGDVRFTQDARPAELTADRGTVAIGDWSRDTAVRTVTTSLGLYASDTVTLAEGLALTASARLSSARVRILNRGEAADDALNGDHTFSRVNPATGLTWSPRRWLTAWAGYSEGVRAPTPMELTCASPSAPCKLPNAFLADPPLRMVVARTGEVGARGKVARGTTWSLAVFQTRLTDDLQFINDPQSGLINAGYFANVGETRRTGLEAAAAARTGPVSWSAAYAFVDATYQTPFQFPSAVNSAAVDTNGDGTPDTVFVRRGNHLPGIPAHAGKARAEWEIVPGVEVGASVLLAGSTWARGDENNADVHGKVPGWATVDLDGRWQLGAALSLGLQVSNLLDARASNLGVLGQNLFTGPGRTFGPSAGAPPAVEQFRSVGRPRGAWVTLSWAAGGRARGDGTGDD